MPTQVNTFSWCVDASNYLSNNDKNACKLKTSVFIRKIAVYLDSLNGEDWANVRRKPNHHSCEDLSKKKSEKAKRLSKHLESINRTSGEQEGVQVLPFQIPIRGFPDRKEFRVFGYVKYSKFYLVYLDPKHEVYKE